jgi:hypothetical protein
MARICGVKTVHVEQIANSSLRELNAENRGSDFRQLTPPLSGATKLRLSAKLWGDAPTAVVATTSRSVCSISEHIFGTIAHHNLIHSSGLPAHGAHDLRVDTTLASAGSAQSFLGSARYRSATRELAMTVWGDAICEATEWGCSPLSVRTQGDSHARQHRPRRSFRCAGCAT